MRQHLLFRSIHSLLLAVLLLCFACESPEAEPEPEPEIPYAASGGQIPIDVATQTALIIQNIGSTLRSAANSNLYSPAGLRQLTVDLFEIEMLGTYTQTSAWILTKYGSFYNYLRSIGQIPPSYIEGAAPLAPIVILTGVSLGAFAAIVEVMNYDMLASSIYARTFELACDQSLGCVVAKLTGDSAALQSYVFQDRNLGRMQDPPGAYRTIVNTPNLDGSGWVKNEGMAFDLPDGRRVFTTGVPSSIGLYMPSSGVTRIQNQVTGKTFEYRPNGDGTYHLVGNDGTDVQIDANGRILPPAEMFALKVNVVGTPIPACACPSGQLPDFTCTCYGLEEWVSYCVSQNGCSFDNDCSYYGYCPDPSCGDNSCTGSETCASCPADCPCGPDCGDGTCGAGESCDNCPGDCQPCGPYCGDRSCNGNESCGSCPTDCGACCTPVYCESYCHDNCGDYNSACCGCIPESCIDICIDNCGDVNVDCCDFTPP